MKVFERIEMRKPLVVKGIISIIKGLIRLRFKRLAMNMMHLNPLDELASFTLILELCMQSPTKMTLPKLGNLLIFP